MPLTVGGGVRTVEDIRKLAARRRRQGLDQHRRGEEPGFRAQAAEKFGSQCIVVAIDAKQVSADGEATRWEIFTYGGRNATGIDAVALARAGGGARGRARSCSPPWTATAPRPATTSRSCAPSPTPCPCR